MDFHEKAKAILGAILKLGEAKKAYAIASKVHQRAKVWRHAADAEDHHWQLKTREALDNAMCELKAAEAECV